MTEKIRVRVVGPLTVAGTAPGGFCDLDPDAVNVKALVRAGHVRVVPPKPEKTEKAAKAEKTDEKGGDE